MVSAKKPKLTFFSKQKTKKTKILETCHTSISRRTLKTYFWGPFGGFFALNVPWQQLSQNTFYPIFRIYAATVKNQKNLCIDLLSKPKGKISQKEKLFRVNFKSTSCYNLQVSVIQKIRKFHVSTIPEKLSGHFWPRNLEIDFSDKVNKINFNLICYCKKSEKFWVSIFR